MDSGTRRIIPSVGLATCIRRTWLASDRAGKVLAAASLASLLISSAATALSPVALKELIDVLGAGQARDAVMSGGSLVLAYAGMQWLARLFGELQGMFLGRADRKLHRLLSERFLRHVVTLPLPVHFDHTTGGLCQTLANGLRGYSVVLQHLVNSFLPLLIEVIAISSILLFLDHAIFVLIIAMALFGFVVLTCIAVIRLKYPSANASSTTIKTNAVLADAVINFESTKRLTAEWYVSRRFRQLLLQLERSWRLLYYRRLETGVLFSCVFSTALGLSAYIAMREVQAGGMTVGDFVLVNAYVIQVTRPVQQIGLASRDVAQGLAFIWQMDAILGIEGESVQCDRATTASLKPADIAFDGVCLAYNERDLVLRDVSFVVPAGKTLAIVGPTGSGKSSIVRLLLRLLEPSGGQIRIGNASLATLSPSAIRSAVAVVPQDTVLLNDTIANNIAIGRRRASREDVAEAAMVAGVHDFIQALPEGYDTLVGERGLRLSGGERQRLAIARAAIRIPSLFIFDEATSSLDKKTERQVLQNIRRVAMGATTIIISHSLATIADADCIIVLDCGSVVESGRHADLLAGDGLYATMWHAQFPSSHRS